MLENTQRPLLSPRAVVLATVIVATALPGALFGGILVLTAATKPVMV